LADPLKPTLRRRIEIFALIGGACLVAFTLQNCEGWHARSVVSKIEPQIVAGSVRTISLVPSNTSTSYLLVADLDDEEVAQVVISRSEALRCKVGQPVRIAKRGVNYTFVRNGCEAQPLAHVKPIG
jgi:hypothetical protein